MHLNCIKATKAHHDIQQNFIHQFYEKNSDYMNWSKNQSTTNNIDGTRSHYTLSLSPALSFVLNGNRWKINSVSQHIFQLLKFIISSLNVVDGFDNTQYGYRMTSTHRYWYVANSKLWINGKHICWLKANRNELFNPKNCYLFKKNWQNCTR